MLILSIDTSTRMGSAALLRNAQVLEAVSGFEETPYSMRLFRDVTQLQELSNIRLNQVDVFAVAAGPGSFTGLRVGLTAVKAWAEVHRKPIAAISGLEAIAAEFLRGEISPDPKIEFIAPFLDARRGQIFGAIYRRTAESGLALVSDESILSPQEFLELVEAMPSGQVKLVSPAPDLLSAATSRKFLNSDTIAQVSGALAPAIGRLGFERAQRGDLVEAIRLDANYLRRSDAESSWKDG